MDNLEQLKARAYDLISFIESAKRELGQTNDKIRAIEAKIEKEEKKDGE